MKLPPLRSSRLDAEGVVLEVVEAAVDSGGGDEEGEAGGDDESEAVPRFVLHDGQGAEESVGEQEDEGAEQGISEF